MTTLDELRRTPNALAKHYRRFGVADRLLLTGHSHQAWPDVALEGIVEAFEDAARCVDDKWERAFAKAEEVREGFRTWLGEPRAELALGGSTHELVLRFLSALELRALMKREGFETWPKLTGGKGIHLMAPLDEPMVHDQTHRIARSLCSEFAARDAHRYILSAQARRRGRIFLDYLRNGRGTTAIGTYSPRARERFPIAAPVTWARIERGIRPDAFTIETPFRVKRR